MILTTIATQLTCLFNYFVYPNTNEAQTYKHQPQMYIQNFKYLLQKIQ